MSDPSLPSYAQIQQQTEQVLHRRPCLWQIQAAHAILKGNLDIITIAAMGSGKTLVFWMPHLFQPHGIQIMVAPLNILGVQNVKSLEKVGIKGILALSRDSATHENFQVIITNPEVLMKAKGGFEDLWKNEIFTSRIISIIWDEAHCNTPVLKRSNDQPNICLTICKFQYPMSSFLDLAFLVPQPLPAEWKPQKFLVFFDDISESMTAEFQEELTTCLREGDGVFGLCCTDLFGMDIDLQDITLVIQWRMTCNLCTLWEWTSLPTDFISPQRFGCGACDPHIQAMVVAFVESKYFDKTRQKKAVNKEKSRVAKGNGSDGSMDQTKNVAAASSKMREDHHALELQWLAEYNKKVTTYSGQKVQRTGNELGSAEDNFANAGIQHFRCYRSPLMLYFGNDGLANDSHLCDPDTPCSCTCCQIQSPPICCELCHPSSIKEFAQPSVSKPSLAAPRSTVKDYIATPHNMELRCALHSFRTQTCIIKYGQAYFCYA
ncbi:hypothetical protein V8E55_005423 [Tylopilus felleus]